MKNENLINFYNLIIPSKLKENEFVRILAIKTKGKSPQKQKPFFIKSVDELEEIVNKYKHNWNLYISLSTNKGNKSGSKKNAFRRQVLFFDFDKKDFPEYSEAKEFIAHIKRKLPELFNHAIIDSGYGYHVYVATQATSDTKRITSINKRIGKILGSDMKAVLPTQITRIPTSLNHKFNDKKPVNVIINTLGTDKFKPYKLSILEKIITTKENSSLSLNNKLCPANATKNSIISRHYCITKMLDGVKQGERNFALGRITKHFELMGYKKEKVWDIIKEWNLRCTPAKHENEVLADFERFWANDYKLLGCNLPDERKQAILSQYCDRYQCKAIQDGEEAGIISGEELNISNHLLKNKVMRKLTGNHYLILVILHINSCGLTFKELEGKITGGKQNKPCMSYNTQRKVLRELVAYKYITVDDGKNFYKLSNFNNYGLGYTRYYYSASLMLINKLITPKAYLVYLCLIRNWQAGESVTYNTLSEELNIDSSNIGKHISSLKDSQILQIEKVYSDKGFLCNRYTLIA